MVGLKELEQQRDQVTARLADVARQVEELRQEHRALKAQSQTLTRAIEKRRVVWESSSSDSSQEEAPQKKLKESPESEKETGNGGEQPAEYQQFVFFLPQKYLM